MQSTRRSATSKALCHSAKCQSGVTNSPFGFGGSRELEPNVAYSTLCAGELQSPRLSAFGAKRTSAVVWLRLPWSRMTHLRHWLCTAPIVSVPIKVPVSADAMLSSELGNRYAAMQVHHVVGGTAAAWPLGATRSSR